MSVTRRSFFARAGAIATAQGLVLKGQQPAPAAAPVTHAPGQQYDPHMGTANAEKYFKFSDRRAKVALSRAKTGSKNIYDALVAIDDQIRPALKTRKYVLIKLNGVEAAGRLVGSTQPTQCTEFSTTWLRASRVPWWSPRFRGRSGQEGRQRVRLGQGLRRAQAFNIQVRGSQRGAEPLRAAVRDRLRHAPDPHPAGSSIRGPRCFRDFLGGDEDAQHGGGHHDDQEHGPGSAAGSASGRETTWAREREAQVPRRHPGGQLQHVSWPCSA